MTVAATAPTVIVGAVPPPAPARRNRGRRGNRPGFNRRRRTLAQLLDRDGTACFYCGTGFTDEVRPTFDHVLPLKVRHTWATDVLVLACDPCNQGKAGTEPHQVLAMLGLPAPSKRAARGMEPAALLDLFRPVRGRFAPGFHPSG